MRTLLSMILVASLVLGGGMLMGPAESGEVIPEINVLTPRGPIRIDGNENFTAPNGVSGGDGSAGNPWIIEEWEIDGTGHGYCVYIGNTTDHFVVRHCVLHNASGGGTIYAFNTAAMLYNVSHGTLFNNTVADSQYGIYLYKGSNNVTVERNVARNNSMDGITLDLEPADNTLTNNTAIGNGQVGIRIYSGTGNALGYNNLSFNGLNGIYFQTARENRIFNCSFYNNTNVGVSITDNSNNNSISNSEICGNEYGIRVLSSSGNLIFHNNFIDNTNQSYDGSGANVWDDGYPSGGNYWSDYNGTDAMSGPNQDIPGADGIGDLPYDSTTGQGIQGSTGAQDRYPFMAPYAGPLPAETVPPHALSWSPNGTDVPADSPIIIVWNETMDWASVEAAFEYTDGNNTWTSANGTWVHNPITNVSAFAPAVPLLYETHYVVTVNHSASDMAGNKLDQNRNGTGGELDDFLQWSFTTTDEAPYVVSTQPADGQVGVDPFKPITVTFSERMNRTSTEMGFSYTDGTDAWNITNGTRYWNALRTELTFSPSEPLAINTTFTVTLDGDLATDAGGKGLKHGNHSWWFRTWLEPPAPKVTSTYPPDDAFGVNVNTYINIVFDGEMDTQSVEDAFSYSDGVNTWTAANGTVDWFSDNTLFSFQPAEKLGFDSEYMVTVTSDAKSIYGVNLDGNGNGIPDVDDDFVFGFITTPEPPTVVSHYPIASQRNVPTMLAAIYINFSRVMLINSVTNAIAISPVTPFTASYQGSGQNLTMAINEELRRATEYRVTVLGTAMDMTGLRLDGNGDGWPGDRFTFSFTTEGTDVPETLGIIDIFPRANTTIPVEGLYIQVTFNAAMNRTSTENAFSFRNGTEDVNGTFTWSANGRSFRFTPMAKLAYNTTYNVTVAGTARDVDGRTLGNATAWRYLTERDTAKKSMLEWILYGVIIALLALCTVLYMANRALRKDLKRTRVKLKRLKRQAGIRDEETPEHEAPPDAEPAEEPAEEEIPAEESQGE